MLAIVFKRFSEKYIFIGSLFFDIEFHGLINTLYVPQLNTVLFVLEAEGIVIL